MIGRVGVRDGASGWAFGPYELRSDRGLAREDGSDAGLAAKPLAMLLHLVRNRHRVVPRRELLDAIWPDVSVSDAAFDSVLRDLRRALGDTAAKAAYVATIRSRGLRFVAPVRELPGEASSAWAAAAAHFERALEALDLLQASSLQAGAQRERAELLVALARAQWASGATAEARAAFLDAADVGRKARDGEVLARAALGFAGRTDVTPGVNDEAVALLEEALAALPPGDSALRAEVMARLATESTYAADRERPDALSRAAVAMAERAGDPGTLAYALTARHFTMQRPEIPPSARMPLDDRVLALVPERPPSDVRALALQQRVVDLLELGEGEGFARTLDRYLALASDLEQTFFRWIGSLLAGTRKLLAGDVGAAEQAAAESLELGRRIGSPNALPAYAGQLFGVRREQGRLSELVALMEGIADGDVALPVFRAGRAAVLAEAGPAERARNALDEVFGDDLAGFPRDQNWLATLGTLAPAVARHGSERQVRHLHALLLPYADRVIVVGQGATVHGAASHHLGLLAAALGERERAARHFDAAEALHARLRAPLWLERTRRARG